MLWDSPTLIIFQFFFNESILNKFSPLKKTAHGCLKSIIFITSLIKYIHIKLEGELSLDKI